MAICDVAILDSSWVTSSTQKTRQSLSTMVVIVSRVHSSILLDIPVFSLIPGVVEVLSRGMSRQIEKV